MVWTGAVGTDFTVWAFGVDVAILLAFVALDEFTDVLTDGNPVAKNEYMLL